MRSGIVRTTHSNIVKTNIFYCALKWIEYLILLILVFFSPFLFHSHNFFRKKKQPFFLNNPSLIITTSGIIETD